MALWKSVTSEYGIEDCGGIEMLAQACVLGWALTFLVIAIIAGLLAFGGIAGAPRLEPA